MRPLKNDSKSIIEIWIKAHKQKMQRCSNLFTMFRQNSVVVKNISSSFVARVPAQ